MYPLSLYIHRCMKSISSRSWPSTQRWMYNESGYILDGTHLYIYPDQVLSSCESLELLHPSLHEVDLFQILALHADYREVDPACNFCLLLFRGSLCMQILRKLYDNDIHVVWGVVVVGDRSFSIEGMCFGFDYCLELIDGIILPVILTRFARR